MKRITIHGQSDDLIIMEGDLGEDELYGVCILFTDGSILECDYCKNGSEGWTFKPDFRPGVRLTRVENETPKAYGDYTQRVHIDLDDGIIVAASIADMAVAYDYRDKAAFWPVAKQIGDLFDTQEQDIFIIDILAENLQPKA